MKEELFQPFFKALKFAADRHRFSKSKNEEPYINHLINVCFLLFDTGEVTDAETITAAILHDVLEKTNTKSSEIRDLFGETVWNVVIELTDAGNKREKEKWQSQLNKIGTLMPAARVIKLADKIENVRSVLSYPPKGWDIQRRAIYIEWSEKIINALKGTNDKLELYFENLLKAEKVNNPMFQRLFN